ncbi:perlucin-like [Haliotis rufescens]|uniref:perlucin-like n=1 Tax=Haliotis rufescens TaxID=6454 RepID=UPI00201F2477|nr:perlucin-like [Haliotis rufescens]
MLQAVTYTQLLLGLSSKIMLFILILTSVVHYASPVIQTAYGTKWINFANVIVRTNIISEVQDIGNKFNCVTQCLQNIACVSAFYRRQHRRCQLHDVLFLSPQDGEQEMGTAYYSVAADGCPSTYVHNRMLNICYQLQLNEKTFVGGVADCNSRGDHFIVIDTEAKQDHIWKQVNSSTDAVAKKYLIDGSDKATEGTWLLHDGRLMTYLPWSSSEPKNLATKNFIVADTKDNFLWTVKAGDTPKYYICERDI